MTHLTQPTSSSCVPTCLAMVMGMDDPQPVIDRYGESFSVQDMVRAMIECGIRFNVMTFPNLVLDGWYILTVPSLNITGGLHAVLARVEEGGLAEVLDPNKGKEDKLFYIGDYDEPSPGCRIIRTWSEPFCVLPSGKLPEEEA